MRSFMFDILQGDMTRSKVILTFTCLKMYIARSGDTSGSRTTLSFCPSFLFLFILPFPYCHSIFHLIPFQISSLLFRLLLNHVSLHHSLLKVIVLLLSSRSNSKSNSLFFFSFISLICFIPFLSFFYFGFAN